MKIPVVIVFFIIHRRHLVTCGDARPYEGDRDLRYEGDPLPEDFVCPLCKHGPADFEPIG